MDEFQRVKKEVEQSSFRVQERKGELSEEQLSIAESMNKTIGDDQVLLTVHTSTMTDEEMKSAYSNKYEEGLKQEQKPESDRQKKKVRKQAEDLGASAMKLHKQLMQLADDGTDYKALMDNNFALSKIVNYKGPMNPEMKSVKKNAASVFERGLKISHALMALSKDKEKYPQLYAFALESHQQTMREWQHLEELAERSMTFKVTVDKAKEQEMIREYESKRTEEKKALVDNEKQYWQDFNEHMKQKKVNWDSDDDSDGVEPTAKKVLKQEMQKILAEFPDTTPDEVESTVNEYLKRIAENTEFRIRMQMGVAGLVLNSRYRSKQGIDAYQKLVEKQYSKIQDVPHSHIISFGSLGGLNAKDFCGYGTDRDPCYMYGDVSIRLDKKAMKNKISFVSGNSKGFYDEKIGRSAFVDEKNGVAPDITMCGANLTSIYRRARELKERNWEGMLSSEQEAGLAIDGKDYPYFEAHYHGTISAEQIAELTYICSDIGLQKADFRNKDHVEKLKQNETFRDLYERVKIINKNPAVYHREGKEELKLTVWDLKGNSVSYEDLKSIFG